MAPRRKNVFNDKLKKEYPFFKTTISESDLRCEICSGTINIANKGKSEIDRHIESTRHKTSLAAASKSRTVGDFFSSSADYRTAALEGVWSYHVIKSNHSFRSSDCASKIFRTCFEIRKFHCARTKCEAIVTNVLAPFSTNQVKADLDQANYVCITADASNHGNIKLMPVVVRYFKPTEGVKVKLLEAASIKGESSEIITDLIKDTAEAYAVLKKMVGFCGDNCPTNFGSRERGGQRNVYFRLKLLVKFLIGIGCAAHIVHNALKCSCEAMPFDVECIVVKIYSHFYLYTVRVETLKSFCDGIDGVEYSKLLGYSKTRFLALGPSVGSILKVYEALKSYFLEMRRCPTILKDFFENPFSKLWLLFIKSQVSLIYRIVALNCFYTN